jgi:hypothetical protein
MIKLFNMYYNLFNCVDGENTCLKFTVFTILILVLIGYEIFCKLKKRKSMFF